MKYVSLFGGFIAILVAFSWSKRRTKQELAANAAMRGHIQREYSTRGS